MAPPVRVLHVDDEPDFAEMAGAYLKQETNQLRVETATHPDEGLDLLTERDFDCVISDYEMPDKDGVQFLEAVRDIHPDMPFILFTGKGSEEIASDAISAGVTDYIQKQRGQEVFQLLANRILDAIELRRSKANYQEIFDQSPDGMVVHDAEDGSFVDMNEQYADLFGYDKAEFLEAGFEAIHPDEPPYTLEHAKERVEQALETGPQTFEWPGVRKDGSRFWAEVHLRPTTLHGEKRILASVRDVTERREYEQELERERARTEYALRATNSYIFEVDFETGEEQRYGSWDVIHGIDSEAVPTTEAFIDRGVHPEDRDRVRAAHEEFDPAPGATVRYDYRTHPDRGTVRHVRAMLKVQTDPADGALRGIGLATDVTELNDGRDELERKNERLEAFTSIVSHDLRNPLSVAEGHVELAQEECNSESLDAAQRAHARMRRLIEDLLALAREGEPVTDTQAVDLAETVDQCWEHVTTAEGDLAPEVTGQIEADPLRVRQLLENLFANAIEHTDGTVTVTVGDLDDGFYVADDGPGISEHDRSRVFESGYTTTSDGTGFGLNIVKEIADSHDWDVALTESETGGVRFEFTGVQRPS